MVDILKIKLENSVINLLLPKIRKIMSVNFNVINFMGIYFNFILRWHFNETCKWIRKKILILIINTWNKTHQQSFFRGETQ